MNKIKILRIIARLNIGGPAIHTVLLTEGLDKGQFDSLLICGAIDETEGDMLYYAREKNVRPYFIAELSRRINPLNDFIAFSKIYNLIRVMSPDIIHTHTAKAGTIGRVAGIMYNLLHLYRKKRIKLVHTFHGHVFDGYFNKIATRIFICIEGFLAHFTDIIITVGDSVKEELVNLGIGDRNRIKIVPLGFELDKFLNIPLLNKEVSQIGIVGRLVSIKNHRLFLEAAERIARQNNSANLKFSIIGDGELRQNLEDYASRLGIERWVSFLGWKKDLAEVYSSLDIVCLTSLNEGTPVSIIEAMASGRPVIATDVGGVRDLLGKEREDSLGRRQFKILERGLIVGSGDGEGFADALVFMLQNKKLREDIALGGREFVKHKFSKVRLLKDMELIYKMI